MIFDNYNQLISYINSFLEPRERVDNIIQYFIDNVEFDYVIIEHLNQIVTPKFAAYTDRLFPNTTAKSREKAICFIRNSSNISDAYWNRLRQIYLTPVKENTDIIHHPTMLEALSSIQPEIIDQNGLLKKGDALNIVTFAKRLCDDCNIPSLIIDGISSGKMKHYWLDIKLNNNELFYDIIYSLYVRDNFCDIGRRYSLSNWIGMTPKQLYKNQPTRTIHNPKGFNLKSLALSNSPLCMSHLFK